MTDLQRIPRITLTSGADQWLHVISGSGVAAINRQRHALRPATFLLIERGDRHEIRNTERQPLKMLNFYVPPAYTSEGNERAPAKPADAGGS